MKRTGINMEKVVKGLIIGAGTLAGMALSAFIGTKDETPATDEIVTDPVSVEDTPAEDVSTGE